MEAGILVFAEGRAKLDGIYKHIDLAFYKKPVVTTEFFCFL
jgi:hypothetical protein